MKPETQLWGFTSWKVLLNPGLLVSPERTKGRDFLRSSYFSGLFGSDLGLIPSICSGSLRNESEDFL